jgi:hypothetical protein
MVAGIGDNTKGANWRHLFAEVMAETDRAKLKQEASDLEEAIFFRCLELKDYNVDHPEKEAMREAAVLLLHIRVEMLEFPLDPNILRSIRHKR